MGALQYLRSIADALTPPPHMAEGANYGKAERLDLSAARASAVNVNLARVTSRDDRARPWRISWSATAAPVVPGGAITLPLVPVAIPPGLRCRIDLGGGGAPGDVIEADIGRGYVAYVAASDIRVDFVAAADFILQEPVTLQASVVPSFGLKPSTLYHTVRAGAIAVGGAQYVAVPAFATAWQLKMEPATADIDVTEMDNNGSRFAEYRYVQQAAGNPALPRFAQWVPLSAGVTVLELAVNALDDAGSGTIVFKLEV